MFEGRVRGWRIRFKGLGFGGRIDSWYFYMILLSGYYNVLLCYCKCLYVVVESFEIFLIGRFELIRGLVSG